MELQKFIDILSKSDDKAIAFFRKHGKNIFTNNKLLLTVVNLEWNEKKWYKLIRLAWIIPDELWDRSNEKKLIMIFYLFIVTLLNICIVAVYFLTVNSFPGRNGKT